MMHPLLFSMSLIVFAAAPAVAQPNQYADFQRAISEQRSSAAYLDKIAEQARTPNTPYTGYSGNVRSAYNSGINSDRNKLTDTERKSMAAFDAERKQESDARLSKMAQREEGMRPFEAAFRDVGFFDAEGTYLARNMVSEYGVPGPEAASNGSAIAGRKIYFDHIKDTASFDLMMVALSAFENDAPATAFYALQAMRARFPDKERQLDIAAITNMIRYFQYYAEIAPTEPGSLEMMMTKEYFKLAEKYPEMEKTFLETVHKGYGVNSDPYKVILSICNHQRNNSSLKGRERNNYRKEEIKYEARYKALK